MSVNVGKLFDRYNRNEMKALPIGAVVVDDSSGQALTKTGDDSWFSPRLSSSTNGLFEGGKIYRLIHLPKVKTKEEELAEELWWVRYGPIKIGPVFGENGRNKSDYLALAKYVLKKFEQPQSVVDGDGDKWELQTHGKYQLRQTSGYLEPETKTLEQIRTNYGIRDMQPV